MSRHRLEITLDERQLKALDEARGFEPRASYVKRWIETLDIARPGTPGSYERERRAVMRADEKTSFSGDDVARNRRTGSKPVRDQFGSGGEWQDAVRAWKAAQ